MVQYIDENGFLYVQPIGGWDMQLLLGQYLTVWAKDGPDHRRRLAQGDASADARRTSQGADLHRYLGGYSSQGQSRGRVGRPPGRYRHVRTRHARLAKWIRRLARNGRQGRSMDRLRSAATLARATAQRVGLCRVHSPRGTWPARRNDEQLRHSPDSRHRRRCDARHRYARQRQETLGRHEAGRRPGALSRREYQSARVRETRSDGKGTRIAGTSPRCAACDGHGRQCHSIEP